MAQKHATQVEAEAYQVIVIGGGNAALCAALTAREAGASVLILEVAPKHMRGGNSRHTRNFRCCHATPLGVLLGSYPRDAYWQDLLAVTAGKTDKALAGDLIDASTDCYHWMEAHGVQFQSSLTGSLSLSETNAFFLGGGKALLNAYYQRAEALGIGIAYNAEVKHIALATASTGKGKRVGWIDVVIDGKPTQLTPQAVVVAAGGFEANLDWLEEAWGVAARNFIVRGSPYNKGRVLGDLLKQGLDSVSDPRQCHAVAIDGRSPKYDGGIVTRLDCVPFSLVVNKHGKRFYDEGEDVWPKRYAIWGRLVAKEADQIAYVLIDSSAQGLFMPTVFPPVQADSIGGLAEKLGLPKRAVESSVAAFNAACPKPSAKRKFIAHQPDGLATTGITPPKSNWARPLITPPFYGYSMRVGVTFTYLGLKVDGKAKTYAGGVAVDNLWAAGEIMAGNILGQGYLAGIGMTIGTAFGRIAGEEAASYVA